MNFITPVALLSALASWGFLIMTFISLLSGYFETRTCLTDCVRNYYIISALLGLAAIVLASISVIRSGFTLRQGMSWLFAVSPIAIIGGIFIIGYLGAAAH
ncbi:MAG: hypothetical protein P8179_24030 [Candidatus Thiodiazotropha sp.]|jgi:hypothetical protein